MHHLGNQFFQGEVLETGYNQENGYELSPEFEMESGNNQEAGYNQEYNNENSFELAPEFEMENSQFETGQFETGQFETQQYEIALAQELMEVSNEAEFFDWLKSAAKKTAGAAVSFLDSPTGQQVVGTLTNIAQKTLPAAAAAAGGWLGKKGGEYLGGAAAGIAGPEAVPFGKAAGGWAGGKAGSWAGGKVGQWAADRFPAFVRFTTDTLRNLAKEIQVGNMPAVRPAIISAARKHYPIVLKVKGTLYARRVNRPGSNGSLSNEYELNPEYTGEISMQGEAQNLEGTFNEVTEMELASELLSINSEAELDQFLGKLFKKIGGGIKSVMSGPLGGMLKGIAKKVLPIAGGALGSLIAPGIGTAIGSRLGSAASNLFELELEGLSAEDREFETARAYIRFAGNAARRAAFMRNYRNPYQASRSAIINAARMYAPGLLVRRRGYYGRRSYGPGYAYNTYNEGNNGNQGNQGTDETTNSNAAGSAANGANASGSESGSWYREGNRIVLQGV